MPNVYIGLDLGSISSKLVVVSTDRQVLYKDCKRTFGRPAETVTEQLKNARLAGFEAPYVIATGSGARLLPPKIDNLTIKTTNEFKAITEAIGAFYPDIRTIFEMGGESSKYIRLDGNGKDAPVIAEYGVNGDCAAGTGSFIDQQAERLQYNVEEIGPLVKCSSRCAQIAGRCSVFAKSDMIHAQQKGYTPPEVLKGLCLAVARNFKATIVKGRHIIPKTAFIGGLALNIGVIEAIKDVFEFHDGDLIIPQDTEFMGAIGAALTAKGNSPLHRAPVEVEHDRSAKVNMPPLSTKNVRFLRDCVKPYEFPKSGKVEAYLGIDIGSVSTNFVILDKSGSLIMEIYTYTKARPIEVVSNGLKEIESAIGDKINICGVGTTGSGRELIGELIGADVIKDEITAHKTGALHICKNLTGETVDTIFEIGGQDAKYIKIDNGVVTDFAMNEACAAGTGSFLEEQAGKLKISIKNQFANLALTAKDPVPLGERCTVFMERDVNAYQLKNVDVKNIAAGLAYSVVTNYLNRVVRGRHIGEHIFFQGGTAYNDAVAAAFSQILNKTITVPPHNGVVGAIGVALLARSLNYPQAQETKFRGFDVAKVQYTMREFSCGACSNNCDIQEFNVEGEKTFWGDKCSTKFRKKTRTNNKPLIEDLFKLRQELLEQGGQTVGRKARDAKVGIPRAMFYFDRYPFWRVYFEELGFTVVVSDETNKTISHDSLELSVAEPCYPIKLVNGHVKNLLGKGVDYIFLPNVISSERTGDDPNSPIPYLCPWHQTMPFVSKAVPSFAKVDFLTPTVQFEFGMDFVEKSLRPFARKLGNGANVNERAVRAGYSAQMKFSNSLQSLGRKTLKLIKDRGENAIILAGRPYNIYDTGANLNVPAKLREYYGLNVVPLDLLPLNEIEIRAQVSNMFWDYGRKIVATSIFASRDPSLHMIYLTNFKCGPDSFVKHYSSWATEGKPYLILQFDEHANDAGVITRIEAYLDSKGLLKQTPISKSQIPNKRQLSDSNNQIIANKQSSNICSLEQG